MKKKKKKKKKKRRTTRVLRGTRDYTRIHKALKDSEETMNSTVNLFLPIVQLCLYSRSHGNIAITDIMSNGGKTMNGVYAARRSNVECALRLNVLH